MNLSPTRGTLLSRWRGAGGGHIAGRRAAALPDLIHQPARHVGRVWGDGVLGGGSEDERISFAQDRPVCWRLALRRLRGVRIAHVPPRPFKLRAPLQ